METKATVRRVFGDLQGTWYKGNLHTHSTESDGKKAPQEVVDWYKSRGYNFLSLTDHRKVTDIKGDSDFLCIPGVELNTRDKREGRIGLYHVVGVGVAPDCECRVNDDPQALIDAICQAGGLAFVAHPKWSGNVIDNEFLNLKNYAGIEVFNFGCHVDNNTGQGDIYWDMLSLHGKRLLGFATDDAHSLDTDGGGGWLMVKAEALTTDAVLSAIRQGHFYASSGPEIHDLTLENSVISVECSKAAAIHFMTGGPQGRTIWAEDDDGLDGGSYTLRGSEKFVRIEVVDKNHRIAWTNPIYFD